MKRKTIKLGGYSLPLVLGLLAMLAAALAVFMSSIISSTKVTRAMIERRQSFYTCDSIVRAVIKHSNDYLVSTSSPDPTDLVNHVNNVGGTDLVNLVPNSDYRVTSFEAAFDPNEIVNGPLPSGPFAGMEAQQVPVEFRLEAEHITSGFKCGERQGVTLAQISLFQFIVFSDTYTDVTAGDTARFFGRTHINDDFCAFGLGEGNAPGPVNDITQWDQGPYFDVVTSAGRIMHGDNSNCQNVSSSDKAGIGLIDGAPNDPTTTVTALTLANDGTTGPWANYALSQFNGRVQDQAHSVPVLRPPVAAEAEVQPGYFANVRDSSLAIGTITHDNTNGMKFLVDPFRPTADSAATSLEKYACKADIRIIDGTWFLRDAGSANPCGDWPGTPIWSDHLGPYTMTSTSHPEIIAADIDVGRVAASGYANASRFSVYDFPLNGATAPTPGVVSYGTLRHNGATGNLRLYEPGYVSASDVTLPSPFSTISSIDYSTPSSAASDLLAGAQSGFANGHIQGTARPGASGATYVNNTVRDQLRTRQANILPMNFDIGRLQEALADTSAGELGSHFVGRPFNGIVYVTSTWQGSALGYGLTAGVHPTTPPAQGDNGGASGVRQNSLPFPLCSDGAPATAGITVPSCGTTPPAGAQVNALRIINARNINYNLDGAATIPAGVGPTLPDGLSVVSNLPVYLLGDVNTSSAVDIATSSKSGDGTPGNEAWFPLMVGGDTVSLLSNNWDDANAGWNSSGTDNTFLDTIDRCPAPTTYNVEMLTGWSPSRGTTYGGGVINLPQFLEDWETFFGCTGPDVAATIRGSLVAAFGRTQAYGWGTQNRRTYGRPVRDWAFDNHLQTLANQPPGAPLFDVSAITRWSRF